MPCNSTYRAFLRTNLSLAGVFVVFVRNEFVYIYKRQISNFVLIDDEREREMCTLAGTFEFSYFPFPFLSFSFSFARCTKESDV